MKKNRGKSRIGPPTVFWSVGTLSLRRQTFTPGRRLKIKAAPEAKVKKEGVKEAHIALRG
jgi:hypothetical protein